MPTGKAAAKADTHTAVMILRRTQPDRYRAFRTPLVWIVCPLAMAGCVFLFFNLSGNTEMMFLIWAVIGLVVYFLYGKQHSALAKGNAG